MLFFYNVDNTNSVQFSRSVVSNSSRPHELSNHLILCRPLLLLPSILPNIRVFSNKSALRIRWPKYWSFSFNISPSSEHPGLISFRMDKLLSDIRKLKYMIYILYMFISQGVRSLICLAFRLSLGVPETFWRMIILFSFHFECLMVQFIKILTFLIP